MIYESATVVESGVVSCSREQFMRSRVGLVNLDQVEKEIEHKGMLATFWCHLILHKDE